MLNKFLISFCIGLCFPVFLCSQDSLPGTFLFAGVKLVRLQNAYHAGELRKSVPVLKLIREAERALKMKPVSVVEKLQTPPSGNKHDYTSFGVYWWPDSSKPDGLPYIQRDGVRNPKVKEFANKENLNALISAVSNLSLAWYITGEPGYAEHAELMLRTWFIDKKTRMNANLNYAGYIPGKTEGGKSGIIDTHRMPYLIDALVLLKSSATWSKRDQQEIEKWIEEYFTWLTTAKNGIAEGNSKNNHGTWYDVQVLSMALFLNKTEFAHKIAIEAKAKRVIAEIEPTGEQPMELKRTNSWGYSNFNLLALFELSLLAEHTGENLWQFEQEGRSIRKALDYVLSFAKDTTAWKNRQISGFRMTDIYPLLVLAEQKFAEPAYGALRKEIFSSSMEKHSFNVLF